MRRRGTALWRRAPHEDLTPAARRVIRLNNGFQLLFNLLWWMPVFYAYQRDAGLSDGQIFGIQSIYYIAFCLFEIPTGLVADRIGARNCLWAGAVVMTAANLMPVFSPSYPGFLLHFLAIAAGRSLTSGAASACLYDGLRAEGADTHYLRAEGTARALGLAAKVVCWPLVGPLMVLAPQAPYVLSAASAAGSLGCALALPRPAPREASGASRASGRREAALLRDTGAALRALRSSPWLALLMVQGVAVFTLSRICQVNLFQPVLLRHGIGEGSTGSVLAAMTVAEAVASARPRWLGSRLSPTAWVSLLSVALAATLAATTVGGPWTVAALLCVFAAITGLCYPVQRKLINDAIPKDAPRATLLSVESIVDRGVCALAAVAAGAFLAAGRLDALLWQSAAVTCVLIPALHLALRRANRVARTRGAGTAPGADAGSGRARALPADEPVALPVDEGAAPRA
ncbi:MFS transporter [Streptomyces murinus]|uniref:MFS family permease n=1 Tax=Streptomyces murinus TaxID=33900 RepID=A0A7W3RQF3_STRMR|nr:MFS transporter [Streptomyces murinus]MBA9058246.1 MFS family permease [Streptomyces murinus]UWW92423.1 MFS transporter [Streptomyces murinus]